MADVRWDRRLVVVDPGAQASNQQVNQRFFVVLGEALERGERFGLIVVKTHIAPRDVRRSELELAGIRWLKTARDRIAERCAGIAYVLSEQVLNDEWVRRGIAAGPTVYGCPTEAFPDIDSAQRWLTAALESEPVR